MGKASRRKRQTLGLGENNPIRLRHARSFADSEQREAMLIGSTISDYENLAKKPSGKLGAALISRHNRRMIACGRVPPQIRAELWSLTSFTEILFGSLRKLGANPERHPAGDLGSSAVDHCAWALDSVTASIRLIFCGQILGAAIIARGQLERWTENLAFNIGFTHVKGESWESFVARVWDAREKCLVRFQLLGPQTAGKPIAQTTGAFQMRDQLSGAG